MAFGNMGGYGGGGGGDDSMFGGMDAMTGGSLIGAGVGAAGGMLDFMEQRKSRKAQEAEMKRQRRERRIARFQDTTMQGQAQRQASIGLLAQSAFDWGSSLR